MQFDSLKGNAWTTTGFPALGMTRLGGNGSRVVACSKIPSSDELSGCCSLMLCVQLGHQNLAIKQPLVLWGSLSENKLHDVALLPLAPIRVASHIKPRRQSGLLVRERPVAFCVPRRVTSVTSGMSTSERQKRDAETPPLICSCTFQRSAVPIPRLEIESDGFPPSHASPSIPHFVSWHAACIFSFGLRGPFVG